MFKFNDENIFIGYIKQLLATFNLPKYRIYTKEQQEYHTEYLKHHKEWEEKLGYLQDEIDEYAYILDKNNRIIKNTSDTSLAEELTAQNITLKEKYEAAVQALNDFKLKIPGTPEKDVLISSYRNSIPTYGNRKTNYPTYMQYIPYIKDNKIQIYAPKIKDGKIYYSDNDWKTCHIEFENNHNKLLHKDDKEVALATPYIYNLRVLNYTKNLVIKNNIYDDLTHRYLGEFLRFQRDYRNFNLMSLYNCFGNAVCPKLSIKIKITPDVKNDQNKVIKKGYTAVFDTKDKNYKIYMVPIKLFQKYTIAIDSELAVEMCCGLYGKYQYSDTYNDIPAATYACFNNIQFKQPKLYTQSLNLTKFLNPLNSLELAQHEEDLKLFIKVPINNDSSVVVLEGDYTAYSDSILLETVDNDFTVTKIVDEFYTENPKFLKYGAIINKYLVRPFANILENKNATEPQKNLANAILSDPRFPELGYKYYAYLAKAPDTEANPLFVYLPTPAITLDPKLAQKYKNEMLLLSDSRRIIAEMFMGSTGLIAQLKSRKSINPDDPNSKLSKTLVRLTNNSAINFDGDYEKLQNKLITPLQLLRQNTGTSYPFADRLIEYLIGNAITPFDPIGDNVLRAKTVVTKNTNSKVVDIPLDDIWHPALPFIFYNYINKNCDKNDINHDILGYIDKEVEKNYSCILSEYHYENGVKVEEPAIASISSINIYDPKEWED